MNTQDKIRKARAGLILDAPFFGALALRLDLRPEPALPTMATNGQTLFYNPGFVDSLPLPILKACLAHEVLHVGAGHCWRRSARDHKQWNVAADYAINAILQEAGFTLPDDCLMDSALAGKSAEEIYTVLASRKPDGQPDPNGKPGKGPGAGQGQNGPKPEKPGPENAPGSTGGKPDGSKAGQDPGNMGAVLDSPEPAPGETPAAEQWRIAVAQAAQAAKAMGKLPGSLARLVTDIVEPAVDWRAALREFVQRSARNDYDWRRPNRRYLQRGFILPSLLSDELPALAVAVDTSGSIDKTELAAFAAEIGAILAEYQTTIKLFYVDRTLQGESELTREDLPLELDAKGGGGTDFRPAFDRLAELGETPPALVYLTDLAAPRSRFPAEPDYPVLWVCTTDRSAPFGEVVRLRLN
jgi:predicted metal-dependent peptidase